MSDKFSFRRERGGWKVRVKGTDKEKVCADAEDVFHFIVENNGTQSDIRQFLEYAESFDEVAKRAIGRTLTG